MAFKIRNKYYRLVYFLVAIFSLFLITSNVAFAAEDCTADFSWLPNPESDLAGYKIYYGTTHNGPYNLMAEMGNPEPVDGRIHGSVFWLTDGLTYYFVCVAYNDAELESDYSIGSYA